MKLLFTTLILLFVVNFSFSQKNRHSKYRNIDFESQDKIISPEANSNTLLRLLSGYYSESFEGTFPPQGWKILDPFNQQTNWRSSVVADVPSGYDGNKSAYMPYSQGELVESWLITPSFNVANGDSLSFKFKLEYKDYPPDTTEILISVTNDNIASFSKKLLLLAEGLNYPKDTLHWYHFAFSLDEFAGQDIFVAFKNKNRLGDGLFIDFVELGTRPMDAGTSKIQLDDYLGANVQNVIATIANYSNEEQNITTKLKIDDQLISTKVISVGPSSLSDINFGYWNATEGSHIIEVITTTDGDVNSSNDTLRQLVKVFESLENFGWSINQPLLEPKAEAISGSYRDGNEYQLFVIAGGNQFAEASTNNHGYSSKFETWEEFQDIDMGRWFSGYVTIKNKIYVFGGNQLQIDNTINKTQIYDMISDSWIESTPIPIPASGLAVGSYQDTLIYLIGGRNANNIEINNVQIYNVNTAKWSVGTSKPGPLVFGLKGTVLGNKIVVTNGRSVNGRVSDTYLGEINANDPTKITWIKVANYPIPNVGNAGVCGISNNGKNLLIINGGNDGEEGVLTKKTFGYDIDRDKWLIGPDKPTANGNSSCTTVVKNDSLYMACLGGVIGNYAINTNEWLNLGKYNATSSSIDLQITSELPLIQCYPNPANSISNIAFTLTNAADVHIELTDLYGRKVLHVLNSKLVAGDHIIPTDIKQIPPGAYQYIITMGGKSTTHKMIKI
ncbi:MAG: choice-of-anchor J domain-containing protein [Saprospiraceae bacterium]|nr:choice-of-anchor J domain-containing protein [Saprospiraceae bacterium]